MNNLPNFIRLGNLARDKTGRPNVYRNATAYIMTNLDPYVAPIKRRSFRKTTVYDAVQTALTVANKRMLTHLLTTCQPPVFQFRKKRNEDDYERLRKVQGEAIVELCKRWDQQWEAQKAYVFEKLYLETPDSLVNGESHPIIIHYSIRHPTVLEPIPEQWQDRILVTIKGRRQSYPEAIAAIDASRNTLEIQKAILLCDHPDGDHLEALNKSDISVYSLSKLILSVQADCACCIAKCPLRGREDSPVVACHEFTPANTQKLQQRWPRH